MQLNSKQYATAGKPLIILHGLFGSLNNWNWQSRELAREFAVTALDLRNHGGSVHHADMNYALMAKDVLTFLDAQQIDSCYLLGHSMGGKVAMQLALEHPERVERLLVVDIAPVDYSAKKGAHEDVFAGLEAIDLDKLASRKEADRMLAEYIEEKPLRQFLLANLTRSEQGGFQWRFNLAALRGNYNKLRHKPAGGKPFEKPVLFVKGADSNYIGEEHRDRILKLFPAAQIKVIMGAGHWVHVDKPQTFYKIARDFFSREE
ncbi:MAG: alpha/beta fold hydrolase [Pseudohongiellaceae bacterium]